MSILKYLDFDLFLFDLDGTLVNTEHLHNMAYNMAFKHYNIPVSWTFDEYCHYAHYDDISIKNHISNYTDNYANVYNKKKKIFLDLLDNDLNYMPGVEDLINKLVQLNKKLCIVTHSDDDIFNKIIQKCELLKLFDLVITKHDYINKKPHPEAYIKALNMFPECKKVIGFEDSYKGYKALVSSGVSVTSVFVGSSSYYYYDKISPEYKIQDFTELYNLEISNINSYSSYTRSCINKYISGLTDNLDKYTEIIEQLVPLLQKCKKNIYLTGIGKCGHICKKSVSTWQSVGISCHYLNIPDLFHGDFGILKPDDVIIYISNSGKTEELINCTRYIKENFLNVLQICITLNNCNILNNVNLHYLLSAPNTIKEIDSIDMAPTTSSIMFMTLLDMIGVKIAENNKLTRDTFRLTHPGGSLGVKTKNKIINEIIICASGLGSRLYPITEYIPKLLVTYKNKPFINHLIEYWQQYCKNIKIIINEQYKIIVNEYIKPYSNVTIQYFNQITGTADTIVKSVKPNQNILITWCDILPEEKIDITKLDDITVFTYGNSCRYKVVDNKIVKQDGGNIIGIYYIKNYSGFTYEVPQDICDVLINYGQNTEYKTYDLTKLVDIGDIDKYRQVNINTGFETRFFNSITKVGDYLVKTALDNQGRELMKKELNWYDYISKYNFVFTPKILKSNNTSFVMNYIPNTVPLYKYINSDNYMKILDKITIMLNSLHINSNPNPNTNLTDIKYEFYTKVVTRVSLISNIILYFNSITSIKTVNQIPICDFDYVLQECYSIISSKKYSYQLIHGDCNFSNILIDKDNNLFLIDPRGYFGDTLIFGIPDYDYAKILYAFSGYDKFNNDNEYFIPFIEHNNIQLNITPICSLDTLPNYIYNKYTLAMVTIIWLSLAQYNYNNPLKCISSYYYGLYFYTKYLKQYK